MRSKLRRFLSWRHLLFAAAFLVADSTNRVSAQSNAAMEPAAIAQLVTDLKGDSRGPFQAIRWFCPDGSILSPQERCPTPGGIQHGLPKASIERLARTNHLFLGQVLAGTEYADFLDAANGNARAIQYQVERFLVRSDDGWIFRRARFYRGAFQAEDEAAWSNQFLEWLFGNTNLAVKRFYLLREIARDLPRESNGGLVQRIRSTSKEISDAYPQFLDVRVKIHGQPEASDTVRVARFRNRHADELSAGLVRLFDALQSDMREYYSDISATRLVALGRRLAPMSPVRSLTEAGFASSKPLEFLTQLAAVTKAARRELEKPTGSKEQVRTLDVSLEAEALAFKVAGRSSPKTVGELLTQFHALTGLAVGSGLLEWWEYEALGELGAADDLRFEAFESAVQKAQRVVAWSLGMVTATFESEVERFQLFEPMASGFIDDRVRSTILLPLGDAAGRLANELSTRSGRQHQLLGLQRQGGVRGLNPGVATGQLVVETGSSENMDFRPDAVYVLARPPADLKPVAGIATVSEGNLVSHVQLLARNLGIPNAVIGHDLITELKAFEGQRVFYAVSPKGTVVLKRASEMTESERRLIEQRKRSEERIRVPTERVDLADRTLASLDVLRAGDSGRVCGPKAANLGQLKALFPENVAPGFIIPFGVFREHMDQTIPGRQVSYWTTLRSIFSDADAARSKGRTETEIETSVLEKLADLRQEIERMPIKASLREAIRRRFQEVFANPIGQVPVFVRSDTNMEDLKDFTGAGLNLTIPNVVSENEILQAIRRVWASPYRERGYRWRQKYLLNPEDVYPSLLLLKSVNVDKSGVMITTGISSTMPDRYTVAFSRGVGGAVDGQAAEMYEISASGVELLSPAREPMATKLPPTGGTSRVAVDFHERILSEDDLEHLAYMGMRIRNSLPGTPGIETDGPFDVELGFLGNRIWLFQARPFVENRSAAQSTYLSMLDIRPERPSMVKMSDRLSPLP